jgi:hypothetical protein
MLKVAICFAASASAFVVPASVPRSCAAATRASCPSMDETILEKALAGELEEEGAENVFLSEVGWATYLDKNAGSSYNMNQRPSLAEDGYFTPDVFSNPVEGACVLRWLSMVAMAASVHRWLLVGAGWRWLALADAWRVRVHNLHSCIRGPPTRRLADSCCLVCNVCFAPPLAACRCSPQQLAGFDEGRLV